jgi:hypothetical protein
MAAGIDVHSARLSAFSFSGRSSQRIATPPSRSMFR